VLPWIHLDTAAVPGGGELRLMKRGADFSIMSGRIELMNSRLSGSEKALATLSCTRIAGRRAPTLLIGGLGMGFTLRAALGVLGKDARITVVELVPGVIDWARGPMAEVFGSSLDDPRVTLREADVGREIAAARSLFDAILLDVDNGPDGLTRESNDGLYTLDGLAAARRALRPGGVLAVWSSGPDAKFTQRLRRSGYDTEEVRVHAHGTSGPRHTIWLATAGAAGPVTVTRTDPARAPRRR
jgi:spermidine synthase